MDKTDKRYDGRIANYNRERGFGFIESQSFPTPVWFHFSHIRGGANAPLYHELNSRPDISGLLVAFTVVREERGIQARNITQISPFYELEQFLRSLPESATLKDEFLKFASIEGIAHISTDSDLSLITVNRILKSADIWNKTSELVRYWVRVSAFLNSVLSHTRRPTEEESNAIRGLLSVLTTYLGFQPKSDFSFHPILPRVEQQVLRTDIPLKCFRQASETFVTIVPNIQVLEQIMATQPQLLSVSRDEMRVTVLLARADAKEYLADKRKNYQDLVLLDQSTVLGLMMSVAHELPVKLGTLLREQLQLHRLQPYEVGSAYNETVYAGRARERQRILDDVETNHAIFGGRKIGKTWFLKDVCRRSEKDPAYRDLYFPVYISLQAVRSIDDAIDMVAEVIHSKIRMTQSVAKSPHAKLRNTLRKAHDVTGKTILLALDEVDDLLRHEDAYEFFGTLRGLQSSYPGSFKYVFAGFKSLMAAFSKFKDNDPFGNWIGKGNGFPLGCLDEQDTKSLIVNPLKWMGYQFNESELISKILSLTSGHPYYTQALCMNIIKARGENPSGTIRLSPATIESYASKEFFDDVFDIFVANLSSLQLLIGKVFQGSAEPFTESDIINRLENEFQIPLREDQVRKEMEILQACSVFTRTADGYRPMMERINQLFFATRDSVDLALRYMEHGTNG